MNALAASTTYTFFEVDIEGDEALSESSTYEDLTITVYDYETEYPYYNGKTHILACDGSFAVSPS